MSKFNLRGSELKALLKLARKQPVAFAYNPGKTPKEDFFGLHRQKTAEIIMKQARSDGPGNKVAYGSFQIDGKEMSLTCLKTVPALAKKLRAYLRAEKISLSIRVLDADGTELDSDLDEAEAQVSTETKARLETENDADPDPKPVTAANAQDATGEQQVQPSTSTDTAVQPPQETATQETVLKQRLAVLVAGAKSSGLAKALLPKAAKSLMELLKSQDFAKAETLLSKLETKLRDQSDALSADWQATRDGLVSQLEQAKQASPQAADRFDTAWAEICKQADAGHHDLALKMASKLTLVLQKQIAKAKTQAAEQQPPRDSRMPALAALERRVDSLLAALA